jgi:DNA-binding NarL/FixJ family response regulator
VPRRPTPPSHLRVVAALLRIIIVDDDAAVLRSFRRALKLRRPTWEITTLSNAEEALNLLAQTQCDVFVTDYEMPNVDGVQLLSKVSTQFPHVRRLVLSGRPLESAVGLPPDVVQAWVCKGHGVDELVEAVEDLISKSTAFVTNVGTG